MHRIPLYLPNPSILWDRSLPECVLFERTLNTNNLDETIAFLQILDGESKFFQNQCYGIADDMFAKAKTCTLSSNSSSFGEGMFLINSIILRAPKDSHVLPCALKIRGHLLYFDCAFEFASNDYEMYLEVNRHKECPSDEICEVMGNLVVCMYMKRELVKAKHYYNLYQKQKAKLSAEVLEKHYFLQIESRIKNFMDELNDFGNAVPLAIKNLSGNIFDSSSKFEAVATGDIDKSTIIFVDSPILKSINAPFVRCEMCFRLSQQQMYTCLQCRYKTYCSLSCMQKDYDMHQYECLGYKQLTLLILDASGLYRIFIGVVSYLQKYVFNQNLFRKKKTAQEIWSSLLYVINEGTSEEEYNNKLSLIKTTPHYERLIATQYSTMIVTAFRLAVFIDTKTNLMETCFKSLEISPKQKLILVGSLLMRIHCNILLNTYDFEIGPDVNADQMHEDVTQTSSILQGINFAYSNPIQDLNKHFNIHEHTDIWQRSYEILETTKCKKRKIYVNTKEPKESCNFIYRILSVYKDNIAELYFNPELIQSLMYAPSAGQPISQVRALEMSYRLTQMTNIQRCHFVKRFARLFHNHFTEYFMQMLDVQIHQVLSLYSPKLSQYKHSCNPNVEIIVLDGGIIIGKSLCDIKKGKQLCVSYKAHYMRHNRSERQMFLERFNINCKCMFCEENNSIDLVDMRKAIYCETCKGISITPASGSCPKCHTQYKNILTKYRTIISVFENELAQLLQTKNEEKLSDRDVYILQHNIFSHARKYFYPLNDYLIRCELRYARYLALKNFGQQSFKLLIEIRYDILQIYSEDFLWFTYYPKILFIIKILLCHNVKDRLYTLSTQMILQLCDLGLYIVNGQINTIEFYENFEMQCSFVLGDLSLFLKWKDEIVCSEVEALAKTLKENKYVLKMK